jgi:hypothetical protein
VVEEDALTALPHGLTAALQQTLGQKVWIVAGPAWDDTELLR